MEVDKGYIPRLLKCNALENKDEFDEKCDRAYKHVQNLITGLSDKETHDVLNKAVANNSHDQVSLGLLVSILIDPHLAPRSFRDLMLIQRDGLGSVIGNLIRVMHEYYLRLQDIVRTQSIWLFGELIRTGVANVDNLCFTMLRLCAGGDLSPRNITHIDQILLAFENNRVWLDKHPDQLRAAVVTFLRLLEDHNHPTLTSLKQREVTFVVSLIRERFAECMMIGRDLVRLLQNVARIPQIEQLWRDMLHNPRSLCQTFTGIHQLMLTRTGKTMLRCRLTPDMETKISYLLLSVKFGHHKRYQDWFQRQYLNTPEAQTLRCDLIRFIVCVIHPSNDILCSEVMPRWAVIGWLLTTCTSTTISCNGKLALLYDWLFFDPERDNIMNIEPGILVMHNSLRPHPLITATLLDFLCRIIPGFYPPLTEKVRQGINASLRLILEKRVLPTLYHLFDNARLDVELRNNLKSSFKEFCFPPPPIKDSVGGRLDGIVSGEIECPHPGNNNNHHGSNEGEPTFSDDEEAEENDVEHEVEESEQTAGSLVRTLRRLSQDDDEDEDIPLAKVKLKKGKKGATKNNIKPVLEGELRSAAETLRSQSDNDVKCQAMERLVQCIISEGELDCEINTALASCLCVSFKDQLEGRIFPKEPNQEMVDERISRPLFVLFKHLYQLCQKDDKRRHRLFSLLLEMYHKYPRIGWLLLFYLKTCKPSDKKSALYKDMCSARKKNEEACLLLDLSLCQEEDVNALCWLVPEVYGLFPDVVVGHPEILHTVVAAIDAQQLQDLIYIVLQGELEMFRSDQFASVLMASLSWETMEQCWLWQLATAHEITLDILLPILSKLDFCAHPEALSSIMLMMKEERPTAELMRHVMSREAKPPKDVFVVSLLKHWCRNHEEKVGELVAGLLSNRQPNTSPNKRKRGGARGGGGGGAASGPQLSPDQVLGHLDHLRVHSGSSYPLYALDSVQKALQQVQSSCTDSQRKVFSELFALAETEEVESKSTKTGKKTANNSSSRGKTNTRGNRPPYKEPITSEESSEEEEIVKKQPKKRKKNAVGSDSE
ncbi:integrator complex subunit 3 [Thrips palmi]|uniref:SOSS complex subunit A homolog n=1 Tax=Thrips palmi TaxID=161013 RepID=A0A6P8ZGG9_THRPL|nr:integrator complex subunit 3 [Thrips palmi]